MRILTTKANKLTAREKKCCRSISFRNNGMLSSGLTAYADRDSTWVFRAFEGDILIGWALAFQQYDGRYEYQTYVRVDWRRRGVGAKLFNAAAKRLGAEKIRYYLETPGSTEFYHHCFAPYKLKKEVVQRNKL